MTSPKPFASGVFLCCALAVAPLGAQDPLFRFVNRMVDHPIDANFLAVGDLNADGAAEIVFNNGIGVNDGTGRVSWQPWAGPFWAWDAVVADFDGDQWADFACAADPTASYLLTTPYVAFGQPGATFGPPSTTLPTPLLAGTPATSRMPTSVDAGDVDGDGDTDLVWLARVPGGGTYGLVQWANLGGGAFVALPSPTSVIPGNATRVRLLDVDLDGDLDAVVVNGVGSSTPGPPYTAATVAVNTGGILGLPTAVTTAAPGQSFAFGDVSGDGAPDVVVYWNGFFQCLVATAGGLAAGPVQSGLGGSGATLADFDGDGVADLIESSCEGATVLALTPGGAPGAQITFEPFATPPSFAWSRHADFDADGDLDPVTGPSAALGLWMNGGAVAARLFANEFGSTTATYNWDYFLGDFDGDGRRGAMAVYHPLCTPFWIPSPLKFYWRANDGDGFFRPAVVSSVFAGYATGPFDVPPVVYDRDGDGDDDVLLVNASWPANVDRVLDNVGGALSLLATNPGFPASKAWPQDFDGDGMDDVFYVADSWSAYVRYGHPTTGLSAPVALPGAVAPIDALIRDFDADGDPDVLLLDAPSTAPAATLYRNDGGPPGAVVWTPIAQPAMTSLVGPYGAAGRFDADAYDDVAWGGAVFLGSPSGVFVSGPALTPALSRPCAAGDLDGDGLDDLFESCGARRPCLGGGVFGAGVDPFGGAVAGPSWRPPTLLDWDRDGDLDAIHRWPDLGTLLLTNLTRQLARGAVARPGRNASLELFGAPGGFFTLFASTGPASVGAGPWGTVLIDPANAVLAAFGAYPAAGPSAGRTLLSFAVPNYPAFVGLSLYWQAVDDATFHVTNRLVTEVYGF